MLCLLERPSQPVNFNVTSEDDTSLRLTWNEPANIKGEVDYYTVSICYVHFSVFFICIYIVTCSYYLYCLPYWVVVFFACRFTTVMVKQQGLLVCSISLVFTFLKISHHPHNTIFM